MRIAQKAPLVAMPPRLCGGYQPARSNVRCAALRRFGAALAIAFGLVGNLAAAQAPAPASTAGPPAAATLPGADLQRIPGKHLVHILGEDVLSATGEKMGPIVDVLFDEAGKPRAAVIDFGGFLGVGTRKIAIDWNALRFDLGIKKNIIALDIGRQQLAAAPEYKGPDQPVLVVTLPRPTQNGPRPDTSR
jgi:hypothetical protein